MENYLVVKICLIAVCVFSMTLETSCAKPKKNDKALLLVAFGSSVERARKELDNIYTKSAERFKGYDLSWAYTSHIIRKKLAKQGKVYLSTEEAIEKLIKDGYKEIAIQSLHTIKGSEYEDMLAVISKIKHKYRDANLKVGVPLLSSHSDIERTAEELLKSIPIERKKDEAVIFMGHGSHHSGDFSYAALNNELTEKDELALLGTVEGGIMLDDVLASCKKAGIKKAYLIPFMSVAGDHAMNDMAGDEEDSWKSVLKKNNIETTPILRGTAAVDGIVDIWLDHLDEAIKGKKDNSH
ncbi:MAG: sirohydrochlorin cobaltochelatase [Planctomycetota bacterium]